MEILAIIPARGGSKSIPYKNIYPILGKPLIAYSIETALNSKLISRVIVSTDDKKIAKVAKKHGAEIPFIRPKHLAEDNTPDLPVFQHALKWLKDEEGYEPDLVVHLWPTSPFRISKDIDEALKIISADKKAHSIRSITTPSQTPFKMWRKDKGAYLKPILSKEYSTDFKKLKQPHTLPRQVLPEVFVQTGYFSVTRPEVILKKNSMSGDKILPFFHHSDLYTELDSYKDLHHTEFIIKKFHGKKRK